MVAGMEERNRRKPDKLVHQSRILNTGEIKDIALISSLTNTTTAELIVR